MIIDKGDKMALVTKTGETVNVRLEVNPKARRLILRLDERKREAVAVAPEVVAGEPRGALRGEVCGLSDA